MKSGNSAVWRSGESLMMLSLQNNEKVVLVVARKKISAQSTIIRGRDESDGVTAGPETPNGVKVSSVTL